MRDSELIPPSIVHVDERKKPVVVLYDYFGQPLTKPTHRIGFSCDTIEPRKGNR